jgi:hypothetical protein
MKTFIWIACHVVAISTYCSRVLLRRLVSGGAGD